MKKCTKCLIEKDLSEFYKKKSGSEGFMAFCKSCVLEISKIRYEEKKEEIKKRTNDYYHNNKEVIAEKGKIYREENAEVIKQRKKEYNEKVKAAKPPKPPIYFDDNTKICSQCEMRKPFSNYTIDKKTSLPKSYCKECQKIFNQKYQERMGDKLRERQRELYQENHAQIRARKKAWRQTPEGKQSEYDYGQQLHVKLAESYRASVKKSVRDYMFLKEESSLSYLGCTIEFLIEHLKSQFTSDMTEEDLRAGKIHMDHILPLGLLKCGYSMEQLGHYTNLRPLWARDNLAKATQDKILIDQETQKFIDNQAKIGIIEGV